MSRLYPQGRDAGSVYRVIVETLDSRGRPFALNIYGPYITASTARAQATRLSAHDWPREPRKRARIEAARLSGWTEVDR